MKRDRQSGAALLMVLMAMLLLSALGLTLALTTSAETMIAANYREGFQGLYAADSAMELALQDLARLDDWDPVLSGALRSSWVDGAATGDRRLADGSRINLSEVVNQANCGRAASCSTAHMDATTGERPWGVNNPRWRVYLHTALGDVVGVERPWLFYVVVLVADDSLETDGDPLRDGVPPLNPGAGRLSVRAEAFGPGGAHRSIEGTLARTDQPGASGGSFVVRLVSWRTVE